MILAICLTLSCILGFILSSRAIPLACDAHEKMVRAELSRRIHECVNGIIDKALEKLCVQTIYGENGQISRVDLDFAAVNTICSGVVSDLSNSFTKSPTVDISVPLGSVSGIKAFSGKGASVNVSAYVYPSFSAKIESSFSEAGINQTMHKLTLTVFCDTVSVCADETVEFSECYDFNIMQSIIVGSVPFA